MQKSLEKYLKNKIHYFIKCNSMFKEMMLVKAYYIADASKNLLYLFSFYILGIVCLFVSSLKFCFAFKTGVSARSLSY